MHFSTVDYVIFALLLVASAGIGLFYAFSGGRQRTTQVATTEICFALCVAIALVLPFRSFLRGSRTDFSSLLRSS